MVIQGKGQISFPGVLFSSAYAHVSFFCSVFPQPNSVAALLMWTHDFTSIHPERTAGNDFLWPLKGQRCSGLDKVVMDSSIVPHTMRTTHGPNSKFKSVHVRMPPLSFLGFLPACLPVLSDEGQMLRSDDSIREKSETVTLVADVLLALKSTVKTLLLLFSW